MTMKKKKYNFEFKVGDIYVDCTGQKGVITDLYDEVDEYGFRGFRFVYEDDNVEGWIDEFEELKGVHRVGEYIFDDYDLDGAYDLLKGVDRQIADLEKEKEIILKGIEYIKQDSKNGNKD